MPHELVNPEGLPPARGFSHAVIAAPGRTVYLGGRDVPCRCDVIVLDRLDPARIEWIRDAFGE